MNEISFFKFDENFTVRSIIKENEPWFVAKDICDVLGLTNPSEALKSLDSDEKSTLRNSEGRAGVGAQCFNIINESGLYALVIRSNKPNARRFRKWITSEVLPSIRKTGKYAAPVQPELPLTDGLPDMEKLFRVKYNGVPVVATQYLAEAFGMPRKQLYEVYRKHWKMFVDSVDVFRLKGLTGEIHKTIVDAFSLSPGGRFVNLWTASGVRKFQELLNKSFIPHKQLCCSEVSPAESRIPAEVAAVAPVRKKSIFKFFLVSDVPKNLEEETELGKLARAFAKRDPEHGGLEALAEYNALRVMAKKLFMFYDVFDKPKGWGGGAGIKDGKLVSRIML